jgi:hypothetical protein
VGSGHSVDQGAGRQACAVRLSRAYAIARLLRDMAFVRSLAGRAQTIETIGLLALRHNVLAAAAGLESSATARAVRAGLAQRLTASR